MNTCCGLEILVDLLLFCFQFNLFLFDIGNVIDNDERQLLTLVIDGACAEFEVFLFGLPVDVKDAFKCELVRGHFFHHAFNERPAKDATMALRRFTAGFVLHHGIDTSGGLAERFFNVYIEGTVEQLDKKFVKLVNLVFCHE